MSEESKKTTPKRIKSTWFWALLFLTFIGALAGFYGTIYSRNMAKVVKNQVESLRQNKISQAYFEYSSKKFQENTTLKSFRKFVLLYEVLSDNKAFIYEGQKRRGRLGQVFGTLVSKDLQEMPVEYVLAKEGREWKIQSIQLKEMPGQLGSVTDALNEVMVKNLKTLQNNQFLDAYYGFFAKEFQKDTPFRDFKEFVSTHPILTSFTSLTFKEQKVQNDTGHVAIFLSSEKGQYLLQSQLKRENGDWKIWSLRLILPEQEAAKKISTDPKALVPPVQELLNQLLLNKTANAYSTTAEEFQKATTFDEFQNFVVSYPSLSQRDLTDFKTGLIEDGVGRLRVNLHDASGMTVMEFKLGFDGDEWRVWGIEVIASPEAGFEGYIPSKREKLNRQSLVKSLTNVVLEQLYTLRLQDLKTAYRRFFSKEYQASHAFSDFENFVLNTPVYTNSRGVNFLRMQQTGKKITLKGMIEALDYSVHPVYYTLIRESGDWKIFDFGQLQEEVNTDVSEFPIIEEMEEVEEPKPMLIKQITIGTEINADGLLESPKIVIDTEVSLIFINVDVENGVAGTEVSANLYHIDSGTSAKPLSTDLRVDGRTIVAFSYSAPKNGWPEGNYLVKVTTDTGLEHLQGFQIRQGEIEYQKKDADHQRKIQK